MKKMSTSEKKSLLTLFMFYLLTTQIEVKGPYANGWASGIKSFKPIKIKYTYHSTMRLAIQAFCKKHKQEEIRIKIILDLDYYEYTREGRSFRLKDKIEYIKFQMNNYI